MTALLASVAGEAAELTVSAAELPEFVAAAATPVVTAIEVLGETEAELPEFAAAGTAVVEALVVAAAVFATPVVTAAVPVAVTPDTAVPTVAVVPDTTLPAVLVTPDTTPPAVLVMDGPGVTDGLLGAFAATVLAGAEDEVTLAVPRFVTVAPT